MNEIKLIHLGRQPFTIAVDAHTVLRKYIEAVGKRTSKDVVEEIEIRMAELLLERGFDNKKVVLLEDVDYLKQNLGEPADFSDEDETEKTTEPEAVSENKRLFRDSQNGILGGVAAGIAAYTGVPLWIVRLAFIGLAFAWGASILLYLALWLILPDAKTPSDRLRMSGKPVTVETLKDFVNTVKQSENAKDLGDKAEIMAAEMGNKVSKGAASIATVGTVIGRAIFAFFGVIMIVTGLAGALYVIGVGSYALFSPASLFDIGALFPVTTPEKFLTIIAICLATIVFVLFISAGLAMVRRRWPLPGWLSAALLALLIAGAAIGGPLAFNAAPRVVDRYNAIQKTTIITVEPFTALDVGGSDTVVTYEPGDTYSVEIKGFGEIDQAKTSFSVVDGILKLGNTGYDRASYCGVFCIETSEPRFVVHAPLLASVNLHDGGTFATARQLTQTVPLNLSIRDDTALRLSYMNPAVVNVETVNGLKKLSLSGFESATSDDQIRDTDGLGLVIEKAGSLSLSGDKMCEIDEPLVYLNDSTTVFQVDGKPYTLDELTKAKSQDEESHVNCLEVR